MSLVADDVPRSTGKRGRGWKREKDDKEGEAKERRRKKAEISLFLLAPTVIPAKLKLPKEVSFVPPLSPSSSTHSPYPTPTHLFRISCALHFGSASSSRQAFLCLLPTNQPRASLMLLLQISGRLLGCLPAGTIGRCVFPSFSRLSLVTFLSFFFSIPSFVLLLFPSSLRCPIFPPSLPCPYLHFILRHAPLLSFSFPEDTHSFVTIVGNGEEVDESMANASSWLVLIWL